jgi:hypothetical protein
MSPNDPDLYDVEVAYTKSGILYVRRTHIDQHYIPPTQPSYKSLNDAYRNLSPAIQQMCGQITFPPDNGTQLLDYIRNTSLLLYGSSDASKKESASHAWVLSAGRIEDIDDPYMSIHGTGPVDGYALHLSSTRGEIQGHAALIAIVKLFLSFYNATSEIKFVCNNMSVIQIMPDKGLPHLRKHRDNDLDLKLQLQVDLSSLLVHRKWVKSHQDSKPWTTFQELKQLGLSRDATYNVWCEKVATDTRLSTFSDPSPDVLPAEKWAVYVSHPVPHKVTSDFNKSIYTALAYKDTAEYIYRKHQISNMDLEWLSCLDLHGFLRSLPVYIRATYVKLIHRWIPTYDFLYKQNREHSPLCPRCNSEHKTVPHIYACQDPTAVKERSIALSLYLKSTLESQLLVFLQLPASVQFGKLYATSSLTDLCNATRHQNLIGWDLFLPGFISSLWTKVYKASEIQHRQSEEQWSKKLMASTLTFSHSIWMAWNQSLHGTTRQSQQQYERAKVITQIHQVYQDPPVLHR